MMLEASQLELTPRTALIVDDEPRTIRHAKGVISDAGWDVTVVEMVETAEDVLRSRKWGFIVLDWRLSEGADAARCLIQGLIEGHYGELNRNTPSVIYTAQGVAIPDEVKYLPTGSVPIVQKPYEDRLFDELKELLIQNESTEADKASEASSSEEDRAYADFEALLCSLRATNAWTQSELQELCTFVKNRRSEEFLHHPRQEYFLNKLVNIEPQGYSDNPAMTDLIDCLLEYAQAFGRTDYPASWEGTESTVWVSARLLSCTSHVVLARETPYELEVSLRATREQTLTATSTASMTVAVTVVLDGAHVRVDPDWIRYAQVPVDGTTVVRIFRFRFSPELQGSAVRVAITAYSGGRVITRIESGLEIV